MNPISILLVALFFLTMRQPAVAVRKFGACRCPTINFETRFRMSHSVARVYVLSRWSSCHLCTPGSNKNRILVYALYTYKHFKGPNPGSTFYAQAFENIDYCGVKLETGQDYMLNLDDPKKISKASHWNRRWHLLEACQFHYNWKRLSSKQQQFLYARAS